MDNALQTVDNQAPQLHIRAEGASYDPLLTDVDLGNLSSDQDVRQAAADFLNVPVGKFGAFDVDRNEETGDITLRPQAGFGS